MYCEVDRSSLNRVSVDLTLVPPAVIQVDLSHVQVILLHKRSLYADSVVGDDSALPKSQNLRAGSHPYYLKKMKHKYD